MATATVRPLVQSLVLGCSLAGLAFPGPASLVPASVARQGAGDAQLVAHEWGTFTSIADRSGQAVKWHPQSGLVDIPDFIEHFATDGFKRSLRGTVRMETPVLYFYSPTETTVSVKVRFAKGVITEWYPHASRTAPDAQKVLDESTLFQHNTEGRITWDSVSVEPNLSPNFPHDKSDAYYYAARETSAAPLVVKTSSGEQQEKFLFYRGVSAFSVPVTAQSLPDGGVLLRNLAEDEIPGVILFERRGEKLGYRLGGALAAAGETRLDRPELTSTIESLNRDLGDILMAQGLYPAEARAMLKTWQSSWFEEGSRLFYIVPAQFVNAILPLSIKPVPSQTVRVFVGRIELITPATEQAIENALAAHDRYAITRTYGRFLEPILDQLKADNPARVPQIEKELDETYNSQQVVPRAN
jgi:hypothetical protein